MADLCDRTKLGTFEFDRHKSWYKLDLEGDFITKFEGFSPPTIKKRKKYKTFKLKKTLKQIDDIEKSCDIEKSSLIRKPPFLDYPHKVLIISAIYIFFIGIYLFLGYYSISFAKPFENFSDVKTNMVLQFSEMPINGTKDYNYTKL